MEGRDGGKGEEGMMEEKKVSTSSRVQEGERVGGEESPPTPTLPLEKEVKMWRLKVT